ncbi:zinc metalloprotease [Aestuariivivens insulae]|uniref:hypothetical protein n=1 Tax=Aestuariivivens insulae TaxID=1621988 RepID=UPI001F569F34|nr:hypothetical protein [Aestuariivivens insulae]
MRTTNIFKPGFILAIAFFALACSSDDISPENHTHVATVRQKILKKNLAILLLEYQDISAENRAKFPTKSEMEKIIFDKNSPLKKYFDDMSYGQFTYSGDIFGYTTIAVDGMKDGKAAEGTIFLYTDIIRNVPNFDPNKYDAVILVPVNDAGLGQAFAQRTEELLINGKAFRKGWVYCPISVGKLHRDPNAPFSNTIEDKYRSGIPTGENSSEDFENGAFTDFELTFAHELIHNLGVDHAFSRTNGDKPAYEPEIPNNSTKDGYSLMYHEYGDQFDIVGLAAQGFSLNAVYRDFFGWYDNTNTLETINTKGTKTVTIFPINERNKKNAVEIRIPGKPAAPFYEENAFIFNSSLKNQGYFLEVRNAGAWDKALLNAELAGNLEGIMIHQTDGFTSYLLDASPSPNINFVGSNVPDLRDVVLKPNMTYENDDVKLYNVIKNGNGSFTVTVDIK